VTRDFTAEVAEHAEVYGIVGTIRVSGHAGEAGVRINDRAGDVKAQDRECCFRVARPVVDPTALRAVPAV
jgi:hypothetical protein